MSLLWYLSRATGVISIVMMTTVMVLGLLLSGARRSAGTRTTIVQAVHRSLALGMLAFLVLHIATAIIDTYVHIGVVAAVLPFTSSYRRFAVGLGALGSDVLIAVVVTSLLRRRLSERVWRLVHRASFVMWPLTLWHGISMSTGNEPLLRFITIGCGVIGTAAVLWRLVGTHHDSARRREVLRQEWT
ncbi:ferric reductase-like transmembrane domain-containing protein [Flexivirga sp.]|uniref:ferric reductase-like transmembrane domain-containing protein n=1 Tax=Flexivirga sp. TaxID=1962927 RepID=UPI003F810156